MAKTQTLSFPIRLPDSMQAEALRLLDESTPAINQMITDLWPQLDRFAAERVGPAWKQVEKHLLRRSGHGSRQERCEMEQAGRILRAQASRKQVFLSILPLLSEGLIRPAEGQRPATKDYRAIKEQVRQLREASAEADAFMAMTNVIEQACNQFLQTGIFPTTYEDSSASLSFRQGNSPLPLTTGWSKDRPIGRRSSCRGFVRWRADPSTSKPRSSSSSAPLSTGAMGLGGVESSDPSARDGVPCS